MCYYVNIPAVAPGEAAAPPAADMGSWDAWLTARLATIPEWEDASPTTQHCLLRLPEQESLASAHGEP